MLVGRSQKYHRPRGILSAGSEEPNALVQLHEGAHATPNLKATEVELYDGLVAGSVNCWPSVRLDAGAVSARFARIMPAGFYYKTFMWPQGAWRAYEYFIRRAAGFGKAPESPDPDTYETVERHCDVLVVGGGPAGLAAALAAGRSGARVILADEQTEFGGALLSRRERIDGAPGTKWLASAVAALDGMEEVEPVRRANVFGFYDHNYLGAVEHLGARPGARALRNTDRSGAFR